MPQSLSILALSYIYPRTSAKPITRHAGSNFTEPQTQPSSCLDPSVCTPPPGYLRHCGASRTVAHERTRLLAGLTDAAGAARACMLIMQPTSLVGPSKPLGHWPAASLPLVLRPRWLGGAIRRRAGPVGWPPGSIDRKLWGVIAGVDVLESRYLSELCIRDAQRARWYSMVYLSLSILGDSILSTLTLARCERLSRQ